MKKTLWTIRDISGQLAVLGGLGYALIWIQRKRGEVSVLQEASWFRYLFWFCLFLYFLLLFTTLRSIIGNHFLTRYDPGDPESVARLGRKRKFQLARPTTHALREDDQPVQRVLVWLKQQGYEEVARQRIGVILERRTRFFNIRMQSKYHRVFLLYRPLLNVLIVDQVLAEAGEYIFEHEEPRLITRNELILLTDMENEAEVLSAGAGVVNFLTSYDNGFLSPILLDCRFGHLFYPQDRSLVPLNLRLFQDIRRIQLKKMLSNPLADRPVGHLVAEGPENKRFIRKQNVRPNKSDQANGKRPTDIAGPNRRPNNRSTSQPETAATNRERSRSQNRTGRLRKPHIQSVSSDPQSPAARPEKPQA